MRYEYATDLFRPQGVSDTSMHAKAELADMLNARSKERWRFKQMLPCGQFYWIIYEKECA